MQQRDSTPTTDTDGLQDCEHRAANLFGEATVRVHGHRADQSAQNSVQHRSVQQRMRIVEVAAQMDAVEQAAVVVQQTCAFHSQREHNRQRHIDSSMLFGRVDNGNKETGGDSLEPVRHHRVAVTIGRRGKLVEDGRRHVGRVGKVVAARPGQQSVRLDDGRTCSRTDTTRPRR